MAASYDPDWVRSYYDDYGMKEWNRWDLSRVQTVKFAIHRHYLSKYISSKDRVLEIGAGAGRFTRELAGITNQIVVADISPGQLQLNRTHAQKLDYAVSVESFVECDLLDLSQHYSAAEFDSVVCFGGVLSYMLDRREDAVRQLSHVTKRGGYILISVMSLLGSIHQYLPQILGLDPDLNERVIRTGDITADEHELSLHRHHLFRSNELRQLLERNGLTVVAMAASNSLSAAWDDELVAISQDETQWNQLIRMEIEATAEVGCLDMGTHMIAVARNP